MCTKRHALPISRALTKHVAACLFAVCTLVGAHAAALGAEPLVFSHAIHVGGEGLGCDACHATRDGAPPVVRDGACAECHDDDRQSRPRAMARGSRPAIAFPHPTHDQALECVACHTATVTDQQGDGEPLVAQARCLECHQEQGIGGGQRVCTTCHGAPMTEQAPAMHAVNWMATHGEFAAFAQGAPHGAEDCALCHAKNACTSCHATRAPADHSGLWRVRAHGLAAGWDRERCTTCHETGACASCHRSTRPMNHSGGWVATHALVAATEDQETCTTCHALSWCAACHNGQL